MSFWFVHLFVFRRKLGTTSVHLEKGLVSRFLVLLGHFLEPAIPRSRRQVGRVDWFGFHDALGLFLQFESVKKVYRRVVVLIKITEHILNFQNYRKMIFFFLFSKTRDRGLTKALRSLSAGVSVQIDRSSFSAAFVLNFLGPRPSKPRFSSGSDSIHSSRCCGLPD